MVVTAMAGTYITVSGMVIAIFDTKDDDFDARSRL